MAVLYKSNVEEAISNKPDSITAFNLAVAAIDSTGLRNVLAAYAESDQLPYFASDNAGLWEQGIGTVTGTTLVRTVVNESSNANAAVDFSTGGAINLHVEVGADSANTTARLNEHLFLAEGHGGTEQTILSAITTKITLFTPVVDELNEWDVANNRFIASASGEYIISTKVQIKGLGSSKYFIIYVYINGVSVSAQLKHYVSTITENLVTGGSEIIQLAAGDTVEIYCKTNSSGSNNLSTSAEVTLLSIKKVR